MNSIILIIINKNVYLFLNYLSDNILINIKNLYLKINKKIIIYFLLKIYKKYIIIRNKIKFIN